MQEAQETRETVENSWTRHLKAILSQDLDWLSSLSFWDFALPASPFIGVVLDSTVGDHYIYIQNFPGIGKLDIGIGYWLDRYQSDGERCLLRREEKPICAYRDIGALTLISVSGNFP